MTLTAEQVNYLLQPLQPHRVRIQDGQSYLPQQDVRAHLTRLFGFGGWSDEVKESALIFEEPTRSKDKKTGKPNPERFDACYRATVRLAVKDQHGQEIAHYEDTATGDAQNQTRLGAHDLALKSAVSTALKRAATCLGDQFGLSLYNKGSVDPFVRFTLAHPDMAAGEQSAVPAATDEGAQEPETGDAPVNLKAVVWVESKKRDPELSDDDRKNWIRGEIAAQTAPTEDDKMRQLLRDWAAA